MLQPEEGTIVRSPFPWFGPSSKHHLGHESQRLNVEFRSSFSDLWNGKRFSVVRSIESKLVRGHRTWCRAHMEVPMAPPMKNSKTLLDQIIAPILDHFSIPNYDCHLDVHHSVS